MNALIQWYRGLAERERRFVTIGGCAALVIVLLMGMLPLARSAAALEQRVATKRSDLAWMRSVAPAIASAGPAPCPGPWRKKRSKGAGRSEGKGGGRTTISLLPARRAATHTGLTPQRWKKCFKPSGPCCQLTVISKRKTNTLAAIKAKVITGVRSGRLRS